MSSEGPNRGVS